MSDKIQGGCACGRIRFEARIDDDEAYLCHCRMCQKASGNVSLAMKNIAQVDVCWSREPDWYDSSAIAKRPFCSHCGTSLGFQYKDSDQMDLTVAAFDDPTRFRPTANFGAESLNRHFLDASGLPEKTTAQLDSVTGRWVKATGQFPG